MKFAIAFLAIIGLVAAYPQKTSETQFADKDFLYKQKFLLEIVFRVEDPLIFEEWIKFGDKFVVDKSQYTYYDSYMEGFWEAYKLGALLPRGEFFGALVKTHYKQAYGLFNFFYYAKDFETFQRNVAWARIHVNEGMFVYALTLAVIHRDDFQGLILPSIYEIFPQYFFNGKFIYHAEKFDYDVFSKYTMYEKEYKDILYKNYENKGFQDNLYFRTKDWKTYQWWKMMGLGEQWYAEDKFMLRENIDEFNKDSKWLDIIKGVKFFYFPVDYTREFEYFNDHSELSYFTEDVGWNAYWYYLNMDYAFFLDGKTFGLDKDRRGEFWLHNVQQILARYYQERLSNGFGEIPQLSWYEKYEYGYDPELVYYNGVGYTARKNYYEIQSYGNYEMFNQIFNFHNRIYNVIDTGFFKTADGKLVDLRKPESIEYIGNYLQGNVDVLDKYFFNFWYLLSHMYFADVDYTDTKVFPHVFLNFETMLRDPFFYSFYRKIADVFYHFKYFLKPYTQEELLFPGVTVKDVTVEKLVTYFDLVDFDVTNLLNDKVTFVDGQFVWDKTLLARQTRLNHKPFDFEYVVESDKSQKVVIRTYFGPKFDEDGKVFTLAENRENFVFFDAFVYELKSGENKFKRSSKDFVHTIEDRTTYTELYKHVMLAFEGKYEFPLEFSAPHCGFPDRLILPKGWENGFPGQFYFFVTPYEESSVSTPSFNYNYTCGIGSGNRFVDSKPFGYPFDRSIDEYQFFVPNGFFKDVKVYHEDKFEKYFEKKYEHFGQFDYNY